MRASPPSAAITIPGPPGLEGGPAVAGGPAATPCVAPVSAGCPRWLLLRLAAHTLRHRLALALLLPGLVMTAAPGCTGADRGTGDPATIAASLQASLASTRANLAVLDPASDGTGAVAAAASPPSPMPDAAARRSVRAVPQPAPAAPARGSVAPARPRADALREGSLAVAASLGAPVPLGAAAARAGPPPSEAGELLGLPAEAVLRLLGEPVLRRPEGPAEVWLYTGRSCALDVILYRDEPPRPGPLHAVGGPDRGMEGAGGVLRVAFAAARATGAEPRSEAACLREIAGGNGSAASGKASQPPADADSVEAARGAGGLPPPGLAWSGGDTAPPRVAVGRNARLRSPSAQTDTRPHRS